MEAQASKISYIETTLDDNFMWWAKCESGLSSDLRRPIGCVVINNGQIIGRGSNQATFTWKWVQTLHVKRCLRKLLGIKKHAYYWLCPGCALFKNHAEARAIDSIEGFPDIKKDVTIYLYGHTYCCDPCLKRIERLGVKKVYIMK